MKQVQVTRACPENYDECGTLDCSKCMYNCPSHAESIFNKVED